MLYICYIYHALHVVHSDIDVARWEAFGKLRQEKYHEFEVNRGKG